jgi:hypothetical protein
MSIKLDVWEKERLKKRNNIKRKRINFLEYLIVLNPP